MKSVSPRSANSGVASSGQILQLGCLAASPAAMHAAIDAGADWLRVSYPGADIPRRKDDNDRLDSALQYAHGRARKIVLDLAMVSPGLSWHDQQKAIAWAVEMGFDAIALSDLALALYCTLCFPGQSLHIHAPSTLCAREASLLKLQLNASRIMVPAAISTAQLVEISTKADVELEVLNCQSLIMLSRQPALAGTDWLRDESACNDACYSPGGHRPDALLRIPLLAALGIRAIHVAPCNALPVEAGRYTRIWRRAIDRHFQDGGAYRSERLRKKHV